MAVVSILSDNHKGAAGRPLLTSLIDHILTTIALESAGYALKATRSAIVDPSVSISTITMPPTNPLAPKLQVNGLATVSESSSPSTSTPTDRTAMRMNMLRKIRPPPFRYAWTIYHEKNLPAPNTTTTSTSTSTSTNPSTTYEDRLTCMLENIITIKTFWEVVNQFPLANLKMKDSVHFFKRGVRPVWEDARNVEGGAWTFRVGKGSSAEFWVEVLLLAVGEQFSEVLGEGVFLSLPCLSRPLTFLLPFRPSPHPPPLQFIPSTPSNPTAYLTNTADDLNGISLSRRFTSDLITIWNRRAGADPSSVAGIRDVVLEKVSPHLRPKEGSFYYKRHSEHVGFEEIVRAAKKREEVGKQEGEEVAQVEDKEAEEVLMREVEEEEKGDGGKVE